MKGVTVNIVKAFTIAHDRPPTPKQRRTFRPKVRTGPRLKGGARRRRHLKPKR